MIFIGGTGRSGTTILTRLLGQHRDLFAFPKEIRFVTDPDGLVTLKSALVDQWSFYQADFAIDRFNQLMTDLGHRTLGRYPTIAFEEIVGKAFYADWLASVMDEFVEFEMDSVWAARRSFLSNALLKVFGKFPIHRGLLPKSYYVSPMDEATFFDRIGHHLSAFMDQAAEVQGASQCVDGTPANLIHADFLQHCFPHMKLIHIYRDPRDVLCSFSKQAWGGSLEQNLRWIDDTLNRWERVRERIAEDSYLEIRFESMIQNPQETFAEIFDFLDLEHDEHVFNLDLSHHHIGRWRHELPDPLLQQFDGHYHDLLERYRYDLES